MFKLTSCWDPDTWTLSLRGEKRADTTVAKNQGAILAAFQKADWPKCIPFTCTDSATTRQMVPDMKKSLISLPIKFETAGTGETITWEETS